LQCILSKRAGFWFNAGSGLGADRPDLSGNPQLSTPLLAQWFNTSAHPVFNSPTATLTSSNFGNSSGE
jgi:hypothetical protein